VVHVLLRVLGHVARQVRLLRVGLATDLTYVRFQVLRVRVLGDVLSKALLVGVTLVAGVAAVRFVGHV
jgi:hypothetical protein